jgi:hypothetical protein
MGQVKTADKGVVWRGLSLVVMLVGANWPALVGGSIDAASRPTAPLHLTTSPLPITLDAKPGQSVSADIKIKQSGGDDETLMVRLLKFGAYGDSGKPALSDFGPEDDWKNWVKFDKPTFDAPNNVWETEHVTINFPKTAAFEYNYAVEFIRAGDTISPTSAGKVTTGLAGGTAVLLLANVEAPGAHRSVQLTSFGIEHKIVEFLPNTFDVNLYNNGNVYQQPLGSIFVTQGRNQVAQLVFNQAKGNILAKSHRVYKNTWIDGFPHYEVKKGRDGKTLQDRHGKVEVGLNYGLANDNSTADPNSDASTGNVDLKIEGNNPLNRIRFGRYTARLVAVYADDYGRDVPITSQITFWVIPWRFLLAFLAVVAVFGFAIYTLINNALRRRRRVERLKRRMR